MKKVYYWSASPDDGSAWYRCQGVFPFIGSKDFSFTDITSLNISWSSIIDCDILFMSRPFSAEHMGIIYNARQLGKRVIVDYDDNFLAVPVHNPAHNHYQVHKESALNCLRMASEVWVSTIGIKSAFDRYNKNVYVIENAHNDFVYPVEKKLANNPKNKKIFYRGGTTHRIDLLQYATEICAMAAYLDKDGWNLYMIGSDDDHVFQAITAGVKNILCTNKIPLIQYFNHTYELNCPLAICPLQDTLLNQSKSNISFLEATYNGSAFVANKQLSQFNQPFIFDINHLGMIDEFVNPTRMRRYNEESWEYICDNFLLSKINQVRKERLLS